MAIRIDVTPTIPDARAQLKTKTFQEIGGKTIKTVSIADSYLIDTNLLKADLVKVRSSLANTLVEESTVGRWLPKKFDWAIEIGFLPGVTDNIGTTALETIEDATGTKFKEGEHVYSAQVFFIEGKISRDAVVKIAGSLHNPLIQKAVVYSAPELKKIQSKAPVVPKVHLSASAKVLEVNLEVSEKELEEIGKKGIKNPDGTYRGPLALELDFMTAIRDYFRRLRRNPTDIELEALAQTWSEHCKHTIFANPMDTMTEGIYKGYIKKATEEIRRNKGKADFCVSVFKDNSGGIIFDEEYVVTHKVETHNSPSALDPFGGAITGVVGVNRDALGFGLGAKPVANMYGFCFAPAEDTRRLYRDSTLTNEMLPAKRIAEGVIKGINAGGNQSGIPTPHGFMLFDESYRGKPLVFAGTVGLIPKKNKSKNGTRKLYEKKAQVGDYIVMVGGRVGLDGIHGATFSSESIDAGSPATSVQIGDPITQKKFSDAISKEARDMNLYSSITDNGAGGLSSSIGEMAEQSGGAHVDLEKVPLKYPGLEPWQIWISESQERMTLAVPKAKWKEFSDLMKRRGVEATVIGEFTKSGKCEVSYKGKIVMDLDLDFLHDGLPKRAQYTREPRYAVRSAEATAVEEPKDLAKAVLSIIGSHNLSSNEFLAKQYDHEVQSGSVIKPVQGAGRVTGDASVFRPLLTSKRAVVLSSALYPHYSDLDPYAMAAASLDSAVRQAVATGASLDHLAILDNFCWTDSYNPERLWQLKEAARACYEFATLYGTPFISGKDSMFNDFKGYNAKGDAVQISALPTLLISSIGVMQDAEKAVSIDAKFAGDLVYVLGGTKAELGGSEYFRMIGEKGGTVPQTDGAKNLKMYRALEKAISSELVASAVSVGRGGLAAAFLKTALSGNLGLSVDVSENAKDTGRADFALFSESQGRVVVTVAPSNAERFEKIFKGQVLEKVGKIDGGPFISISAGKTKVKIPLADAHTAYRKRFKNW